MKHAPMTAPQSLPNLEWEPTSWQRYPAAQQPVVARRRPRSTAALAELRAMPPLVFAGRSAHAALHARRVAEGKGFLLHAGDCAESFAEFSADNIRDKLKVILQMSLVLTYSTGRADAEDRPHRRAVRQAPFGADREA